MCKIYEFIPYKQVDGLPFGTSRDTVLAHFGEPKSALMYGWPIEDSFQDCYDTLHAFCSKDGLFEAVDFLILMEESILKLGQSEVLLSKDPEVLVREMAKVTDDLIEDEEAVGYSSEKLGLKVYCPDDEVESVIVYAPHYYD